MNWRHASWCMSQVCVSIRRCNFTAELHASPVWENRRTRGFQLLNSKNRAAIPFRDGNVHQNVQTRPSADFLGLRSCRAVGMVQSPGSRGREILGFREEGMNLREGLLSCKTKGSTPTTAWPRWYMAKKDSRFGRKPPDAL